MPRIEVLILFRLVEATGAVCAVSTAMIKDCFKPERRTALLSVLQVIMVIDSVVAPLLGGVILRLSTWHATFAILAAVGIVCIALSLLYRESLPKEERVTGGFANTFVRMGAVAKNRGFAVFLLIASLFSVPFMAYVSVASYVYTGYFGTSTQGYTYFFAATAALSVLGPLLYMRASYSGITARRFTNGVIAAGLVASVLLLTAGRGFVRAFFACLAVFALLEASICPYTTNILLAQNERDADSASALIDFLVTVFGVLGMGLMSLFDVQEYVFGLGIIMLSSMIAVTALWAYLLTSRKAHIKELEK